MDSLKTTIYLSGKRNILPVIKQPNELKPVSRIIKTATAGNFPFQADL